MASSYRRCTSCNNQHPETEEYFRKDHRYNRGFVSTCKSCDNKRKAKYREKIKAKRCSIDGCGKPQMARKMCSMHYARWLKSGEAGSAKSVRSKRSGACISPGCEEKVYCQRRCTKHYHQWNWQNKGACSIYGCESREKASGLCSVHYSRKVRHGDPLYKRQRVSDLCCTVDGCNKKQAGKGLCGYHWARNNRNGHPTRETEFEARIAEKREAGFVDSNGYRLVWAPGHNAASRYGGNWAPEHRKIMSDVLNRPLTDKENVHHINGVKTDNRLENLELWVSSQPSGQRPHELVAWAKGIIKEYDV